MLADKQTDITESNTTVTVQMVRSILKVHNDSRGAMVYE